MPRYDNNTLDETQTTLEWDDWFSFLKEVARRHGENVYDVDAWMPEWEAGKSPEDAFYDEYPEHRAGNAAQEAATQEPSSCKKQHTTPCRECPFKRNSANGWLGASNPGEFLALADSPQRTPCHMHVNYEEDGWKEKAAAAPQCVGRSVFLANRGKLAGPQVLKAPKDPVNVFARPHEFVAHHLNMEPAKLEGTLIWDLYAMDKAPKDIA